MNQTSILSSREQQILSLIAIEKTGIEIAYQLSLSPHTIISHRKNMMVKLNAANTAGLIRRGFETGLLSICQNYSLTS